MSEITTSQLEVSRTARVFKIPSSYRWIGGIVMLVLSLFIPVIFLLSLANTPATSGNGNLPVMLVALVLTAMFAVLGVVIYISLVSSRLAVGPGGISYFTAGGAIRAPWARVAGYGNMAPNNRKGLILYQEINDPNNSSETTNAEHEGDSVANTRPGPGGRTALSRRVDPKRLIPLFPFDKYWQEGELGQLIRRYAPQALKDLGALNLADFDLNQEIPDLPLPNLAPDAGVLADNPKWSRTDTLIVAGDLLLTLWALVLIFLQLK